MGWKFRKSYKIMPGVRMNFGKKSFGVSFGGKHTRVSVNSRRGTTVRQSIPKTGISYSHTIGSSRKRKKSSFWSSLAGLLGPKPSPQKQMYIQMAQNDLAIMKDSAMIAETTTNPDVFFSRMDLFIEKAEHLASIKQYVPELISSDPTAAAEGARASYFDNTAEFIGKYFPDVVKKAEPLKTKNGKINRVNKAFDTLMEYKEKMDDRCISRAEQLKQEAILAIEQM